MKHRRPYAANQSYWFRTRNQSGSAGDNGPQTIWYLLERIEINTTRASARRGLYTRRADDSETRRFIT